MSTVNFKNPTPRAKLLTTEDTYALGMKYTDAPHDEGYAKALINFNIKNNGECLSPRGGWNIVKSNTSLQVFDEDAYDFCVHHAHMMYIQQHDHTDAVLRSYALTGKVFEINNEHVFDLNSAVLIVEQKEQILNAAYDSTMENAVIDGYLLMKPAIHEVHDVPIEKPKYRNGIFTSLEANSYVFVYKEDGTRLFSRIVAVYNEDSTMVHWCVVPVAPTEIQPTQAMNYGYNMFKDNPYDFVNQQTPGGLTLTGVLPYDEQGKLLLTARPGTPINFKLFYKYPETDSEDKYLFQWEAQDLNANNDTVVIQPVRKSQVYTPGAEVTLLVTPAYTAFSLVVKAYKQSEIAAADAEWESNTALQQVVTKDENLTPTHVTTLASYYLTNTSNSTILNVAPVKYDLCTATGMCTWQQRIVLWGVQGAKSTLFVSEINTPGYMPYPNNSEIFTDDIVCAIPYMTNLLVFTKSALYNLTLNDDGLSYTTKCVQERLNMSEEDINTVTTVQNMVYFKSGNYFYMIVPNNMSATMEVQMAPISRQIEQMFDNFKDTLSKLLNDLYNLSYLDVNKEIELYLEDFQVYLAGTQVRNVYKVKVHLYEGGGEHFNTFYFDISLNYDVVIRAWTSYIWESTPYRTSLFKAPALYIHMQYYDYSVHTHLVTMKDTSPKDALPLEHKTTFGNYQLIDTGYRNMNPETKKRFREVQFSVNIINSEQLRFHTSFVVDDVETNTMYNYIVTHVTDKSDPNYGIMFVEREFTEPVVTDSPIKLGSWELDHSVFPDITVRKVRYKVSGKGYGGSVKILSTNELAYELLHISWVYRLMYAR